MIIDELIFDRTEEDLEEAKSYIRNNEPFPDDNLRFSWDYRALNRTEKAMQYLYAIFAELGYIDNNMNFKIDWTNEEITPEHAKRYIRNLTTIREFLVMNSNVPPAPTTINGMSINRANTIEEILHYVDIALKNLRKDLKYSGVFNAGQSSLWQHRFRVYKEKLSWTEFEYEYWNEIPDNKTWKEVSYE